VFVIWSNCTIWLGVRAAYACWSTSPLLVVFRLTPFCQLAHIDAPKLPASAGTGRPPAVRSDTYWLCAGTGGLTEADDVTGGGVARGAVTEADDVAEGGVARGAVTEADRIAEADDATGGDVTAG
jgi:hypothetical protein